MTSSPVDMFTIRKKFSAHQMMSSLDLFMISILFSNSSFEMYSSFSVDFLIDASSYVSI